MWVCMRDKGNKVGGRHGVMVVKVQITKLPVSLTFPHLATLGRVHTPTSLTTLAPMTLTCPLLYWMSAIAPVVSHMRSPRSYTGWHKQN